MTDNRERNDESAKDEKFPEIFYTVDFLYKVIA